MHSSIPDLSLPAFIPADICAFLGLEQGDGVAFAIEQGKVVLHRAPHARQDADAAWMAAHMPEWLSEEDCKAFDQW